MIPWPGRSERDRLSVSTAVRVGDDSINYRGGVDASNRFSVGNQDAADGETVETVGAAGRVPCNDGEHGLATEARKGTEKFISELRICTNLRMG